MESKERPKKDPIKDKYSQEVGFFKKIHVKWNIFTASLKLNKSLMGDVESGVSLAMSVVLYGVLGALSLSLFGIPLSLTTFFGTGALLWLIENKFLGFVTQMLGTIKLVDIN